MTELTVPAPAGAHWSFESLRTKNGTESLGELPILEWDTAEGIVAHYGPEGTKQMINGTSGKVSYQSIARRLALRGKTINEIAQAQVDFRPGQKASGPTTPHTRAAKAAKVATERGADGERLANLLDRIAEDPSILDKISV